MMSLGQSECYSVEMGEDLSRNILKYQYKCFVHFRRICVVAATFDLAMGGEMM
jgi:hypothetical protein